MNHPNPRWSFSMASVGILCLLMLYLLSFGAAIRCYTWFPTPETEVVLRIYRPLFMVAPDTMGNYSMWCGFNDIEALLLVQSMMHEGGRMHDIHLNIQ